MNRQKEDHHSPQKANDGNLWDRLKANIKYCVSGVWNDTRPTWKVRVLKVINLSVKSFLDRDLQTRAASLTYYTVLAIVPALAMLFAIGRGFGFQNLLQSELFRYFPAQRHALEQALTYVDNYLAQASQGIFIGIGLIFLLWTLISLMSNVENTFNHAWRVTTTRSLQRKFTDYTALFLLLPLLMVCSAGISIFMSDAVQRVFEGNPISPMMTRLLELIPIVISWIIFTAAYWMIPNTKVNLKYALFSGVFAGTLFQVVQWLFVTGQVYVSKYNAIYGSFAFLPLLLVWMQLSWLITLSGAVLTYACQNFSTYAYHDKAKGASQTYSNQMAIAILALATARFKQRHQALTRAELFTEYGIPNTLSEKILNKLQDAGLLTAISIGKNGDEAYHPAYDPDDMTVNTALNALTDMGNSHFIPQADTRFGKLLERMTLLREAQQGTLPDIPLLELIENCDKTTN